jgi:hypothetical protein
MSSRRRTFRLPGPISTSPSSRGSSTPKTITITPSTEKVTRPVSPPKPVRPATISPLPRRRSTRTARAVRTVRSLLDRRRYGASPEASPIHGRHRGGAAPRGPPPGRGGC